MPLPPRMPPKMGTSKVGVYKLIDNFKGYRAKEDMTSLPPSTLVSPSKNVVLTSSGRVAHVRGYSLDGQSSSVFDSGVLSHYDFTTSNGSVRNVRVGGLTSNGNDGRMEYRYNNNGTVTWNVLSNSLTTVRRSFCEFFDTTEQKRLLLSVDGSNNIYEWNGAVTTLSSANNNAGYIQTINPTPTSGGTGYVLGDILTVSGGSATITVTGVTGGTTGAITDVRVDNSGGGYAVGDVFTVPGGSGTATLRLTAVYSNGAPMAVTIVSAGTGYAPGYFTPIGGSGSGTGNWYIAAIGGQSVSSVALTTTDSGYTTGTGKATTGGRGTGCTINITAVATGAIVKQGATTWSQEGFYSTRNMSVNINGIDYTYTATYGDKIIGISPNPATPGFSAGTVIHQTPVTTPLSAMTAIPATFAPTVIGCGRRNQVYLGNSTNSTIYISQASIYTNYSFTAGVGRVPGEGFNVPIDAPPIAFVSQEVQSDNNAFDMWISMSKDRWGVIRSTLSNDLSKEALLYIRMKTSPLQGAKSERLVGKMKNHIIFIGNDNVCNTLGFISYQNVPDIQDISFPIVDDMSSYDFTDGHIFYYRNYIFISVPKAGLIRAYNMTDQTKQDYSSRDPVEQVNTQQPWFWEAPITYPISGFFVAEDGLLYGHSYVTTESYKLFDGGSFNGQQIEAQAVFAYDGKEDRTTTKLSSELWVEGYIKQNTQLESTITGDLDSFQASQTKIIDGNDEDIVAFGSTGHFLGKNALGTSPFGLSTNITRELPPYFHVVLTFGQTNFYLEQISFYSKGIDLDWQLITFGTDAMITNEGNNNINK